MLSRVFQTESSIIVGRLSASLFYDDFSFTTSIEERNIIVVEYLQSIMTD